MWVTHRRKRTFQKVGALAAGTTPARAGSQQHGNGKLRRGHSTAVCRQPGHSISSGPARTPTSPVRQHRCRVCSQSGHNAGTCPSPSRPATCKARMQVHLCIGCHKPGITLARAHGAKPVRHHVGAVGAEKLGTTPRATRPGNHRGVAAFAGNQGTAPRCRSHALWMVLAKEDVGAGANATLASSVRVQALTLAVMAGSSAMPSGSAQKILYLRAARDPRGRDSPTARPFRGQGAPARDRRTQRLRGNQRVRVTYRRGALASPWRA